MKAISPKWNMVDTFWEKLHRKKIWLGKTEMGEATQRREQENEWVLYVGFDGLKVFMM